MSRAERYIQPPSCSQRDRDRKGVGEIAEGPLIRGSFRVSTAPAFRRGRSRRAHLRNMNRVSLERNMQRGCRVAAACESKHTTREGRYMSDGQHCVVQTVMKAFDDGPRHTLGYGRRPEAAPLMRQSRRQPLASTDESDVCSEISCPGWLVISAAEEMFSDGDVRVWCCGRFADILTLTLTPARPTFMLVFDSCTNTGCFSRFEPWNFVRVGCLALLTACQLAVRG